jgi:hypothetical protein
MKRLLLLLLGLGMLGTIGWLGWNVWETTRYFEAHGREATLVVGPRYNAARWASPLPLKKIHAYAARLEPKYEVLIETDQPLKPGDTVHIRFLTRDLAPGLLAFSARPVVNTLRLRAADDGTPVKIEDTNLFDRLVDKAMGPPAEGVYVAPRAVAEAAPSNEKPTVPFLLAAPGEGTWRRIWNNSSPGEWILLGLGLLAAQSLLIAACDRQKAARRPNPNRKDFVHPSLRRIEADAPDAPSKKLTYLPKPDEEIVLPASQRPSAMATKSTLPPRADAPPAPDPALVPLRRADVPARPSSAPPPATADSAKVDETALPSLASKETAPPMPIRADEPVLKLPRKK